MVVEMVLPREALHESTVWAIGLFRTGWLLVRAFLSAVCSARSMLCAIALSSKMRSRTEPSRIYGALPRIVIVIIELWCASRAIFTFSVAVSVCSLRRDPSADRCGLHFNRDVKMLLRYRALGNL